MDEGNETVIPKTKMNGVLNGVGKRNISKELLVYSRTVKEKEPAP